MLVLSVLAAADVLRFTLSEAYSGKVGVTELSPVIAGEIPVLSAVTAHAENGVFSVARFDGAHDRLYSRFHVLLDGEILAGAKFVTDFAEDVPENKADYPVFDTKKTLYGTKEDIAALGLKQSLLNINLPNLMTTLPEEGDIAFEHDGKTYYFRKKAVMDVDASMLHAKEGGLKVTMILLNSPRLFGSSGEKALLDKCIHPGFDYDCKSAYISAFNVETEEGIGYYRAFVEFLVSRYTRPDALYGTAIGAIISNEVNSQYVWSNAGEMTVEAYSKEYTLALRQAWLCGKKHSASFRVYVSLDQHWRGSVHNPRYPLRYYEGRKIIDNVALSAREDGDFPWCVAYHPYPEDLRWPDFWHDRAPDFTFSTPKITFKNMEVLEAYLSQEQLLYRNEPRRIIFSEQGFNSQNGPMQALTEKMAEAGYVLAYMKARNMKTVDMFMHHSYVDNPHEFGLNLGIRRYDANAPRHAGERKPIWYSVYDMDTEREEARVMKARAFIGDELFDFLLDPPVMMGERDTSRDGEFG